MCAMTSFARSLVDIRVHDLCLHADPYANVCSELRLSDVSCMCRKSWAPQSCPEPKLGPMASRISARDSVFTAATIAASVAGEVLGMTPQSEQAIAVHRDGMHSRFLLLAALFGLFLPTLGLPVTASAAPPSWARASQYAWLGSEGTSTHSATDVVGTP